MLIKDWVKGARNLTQDERNDFLQALETLEGWDDFNREMPWIFDLKWVLKKAEKAAKAS